MTNMIGILCVTIHSMAIIVLAAYKRLAREDRKREEG